MRPPRIALLLKAPRRGEVKTRLAATLGEAGALAIYRRLAERQLAALPRGWPVTIHHAPADAGGEMRRWLDQHHAGLDYQPQYPGDLGARLAAAFAAEFARGAPTVLAIGGDCPGLDAAILRQAAHALERTDVVLGPARDGGYYLIGLKQPQAGLFTGIAWSTPAVLAQTRAHIHAARLNLTELPRLEDVDDAASWRRTLAGDAFAGRAEHKDGRSLLPT
jgi:uncharacterized protein